MAEEKNMAEAMCKKGHEGTCNNSIFSCTQLDKLG